MRTTIRMGPAPLQSERRLTQSRGGHRPATRAARSRMWEPRVQVLSPRPDLPHQLDAPTARRDEPLPPKVRRKAGHRVQGRSASIRRQSRLSELAAGTCGVVKSAATCGSRTIGPAGVSRSPTSLPLYLDTADRRPFGRVQRRWRRLADRPGMALAPRFTARHHRHQGQWWPVCNGGLPYPTSGSRTL